jgi:hypothetical protein
MQADDMRKLERELQEDLRDQPEARLHRVRELVKEFLLEEATQIGGKRVRAEREVTEVIHLYTRIALLRRVIESPHQFNTKDLKELYRDTAPVKDLEKNVNPLALIESLDGVSDAQKAQLIKTLAETARDNIRAQIGRKNG